MFGAMDLASLLSFELSQLQTWLAEAVTARHALATGTKTVLIQWADRRWQYTPAEMASLSGYITLLQKAVEMKQAGRRPRPGPFVVSI
jgi:hypothetical protein